MSSTHMGKWRNPPLAYVVAEVAISPHYQIAEFVPAMQAALRAKFPRTIEGMEVGIQTSVPGVPTPQPEPIWRLLAADSSRGMHISRRALSFHATSYVDFPEFLQWLTLVFHAIGASGLNPFVERIGLRYIDYILPVEGRQPLDYVTPSLHGISPPGADPVETAIWFGVFGIGDCKVNLRVAAPTPPGEVLPPNLSALPLIKAATMQDAEERAQKKEPFGLIDTDCFRIISAPFEPLELQAAFDRMHDHVSETFKSVMSDLAKEEWV